MNLEAVYKESSALLEGHFLLSSGKHSKYYLQSARVLEDPKVATKLANELAKKIREQDIEVDAICSPALGGLIAGYALAVALDVRFIFTERVNKIMSLRRGFEIKENEKIFICEDIITTGGSALESANVVKNLGAKIVGYGALANRGFCPDKKECKLPDLPLVTLGNFEFDVYEPEECPLCVNGSVAIKPGSRGN